jgi:hypothetical protein
MEVTVSLEAPVTIEAPPSDEATTRRVLGRAAEFAMGLDGRATVEVGGAMTSARPVAAARPGATSVPGLAEAGGREHECEGDERDRDLAFHRCTPSLA